MGREYRFGETHGSNYITSEIGLSWELTASMILWETLVPSNQKLKEAPMKDQLQGTIANLPMVFTDQNLMDEEAIRYNIRSYLEKGFNAMYLLGTSGESFNVSPDEYRQATRIFVEEAGPDVLKIVGCATPRLGEALETVQWLGDTGIDCALAIPPYFIPLSAGERTGAIRMIAESCPSLGIVHYNTDYAPGVRFQPEDYASLLDIPNFWGTKQGNMDQQSWEGLQQHASSLRHLTLDDWMVRSMRSGGYGAFSLMTSLSPEFMLGWLQTCEAQDWEKAEAMDRELQRFMDTLYWPLSRKGYTDVAVDKALIGCFGFLRSSDPRPPLQPLSSEDKKWAAGQIEKEGYFDNEA